MSEQYHVGPEERCHTLQDLFARVTPGDCDEILVHPGTYPGFKIEHGGGALPETAPMIRAFDMAHRPVFDAGGEKVCVHFDPGPGVWWRLEGLEICNAADWGVRKMPGGLVLRHCHIHDCRTGYLGSGRNCMDAHPGYLIAEFNDTTRCGFDAYHHPWYVQEYWVLFRGNWVHDSRGGASYKDRSRATWMEANLLEQGAHGGIAVGLCGFDNDGIPDVAQHAVLVGNIFTKRAGINPFQFVSNLRKECGLTRGRNIGHLTLVNNTFYSEEHYGPMVCVDEGSIIRAENNIFHSATADRIIGFPEIGLGLGSIEGRNNWVHSRMAQPEKLAGSVVGEDPEFVSAGVEGGDFQLQLDSACCRAGTEWLSVWPRYEYRHPRDIRLRPSDGPLDIGAHQHGTEGGHE